MTSSKIFLHLQVALSVIAMLIGAAYALRCLFAGQIFCAACFAVHVSGYRLLFKASIDELRKARANNSKGGMQ